jgi:hypothetical protein|tara:strand:- start:1368 stop:1880 length:513 start_codon:yes stop_codon:yes gene_type:complete
MITYKNFIDDFKTVATNHFLINSFHSGMLDEVDINKLDQADFPILYVEPGNTNIDMGVMTYTFTVFTMNLIKEDLSNREEVWSEMLQIMQDVISEFRQNLSVQTSGGDSGKKFSYIPNEVVLNLPINAEPFTVRFANMLTGWSATFTMQVNNPNSLCNAPIEPSDEEPNT